MNIPLFGMLAGANLLILVVWLFRCAQMRGVIEEMKAQKEARQKIDFVDIKKVRPTEGAHILVWDALEKRVIPTLYKGTKEDWEKAKDKESRFTHFLEVDPPH